MNYYERDDYYYRPVLEVPATLSADGLRAVTLKLNGAKLGGSGDDLKLVVKSGAAFQAPASEGLTLPDGIAGQMLLWQSPDGSLYAPDEEVPAAVTQLTAMYGYSVINNLNNLITSNSSTSIAALEGDYTAILTPVNGYLLPGGIDVTVGTATLTPGVETYTYDSTSGSLTISAAAITDNITITAAGVSQSAAPAAAAAAVAKTAAVQASVTFTLSNTPAYQNNQTWTVYAAAAGSTLAEGVTASNLGNALTLSHSTDIPTGTYYVAVTENGKAESQRLALTVDPYQAPSVSLGTDTTVTVSFAYADTEAKQDTIDIITSTGTDTTVTFPATAFTLSDSAAAYNAVTCVSVTAVGSGTLTISVDKDAAAASAYLWYAGKSVGAITLQKTVQGRTAAPSFESAGYSLTSPTDAAAVFTLIAAPADGTVFTVYSGADGTATAGTAALTSGTTLTVTLSAIPASATIYYISATLAPDAESTRTPVMVNPYVKSTNTALSALSYTVNGGTPVPLTETQIATAAQTEGFSVALPFGTSPTAAIRLSGTPAHSNASVTANDGTTLVAGSGTAALTVTAESGAAQTYRIHFSIQPQSAAPTASIAKASKTAAVQASIAFTLSNTPAYQNNQTWTVYAAAAGSTLAEGVTASNVGNALTLSHSTDIPTGTYYVTVTENGKAESRRLALTVQFIGISAPEKLIQGSTGETLVTVGSGVPDFGLANLVSVQVRFENEAFVTLTNGSQYEAAQGSIKLTLHKAYLDTLVPGCYTLRVNLTGPGLPSNVDTQFTIVSPAVVPPVDTPPQTGDSATPGLWVVLLAASVCAAAGITIKHRAPHHTKKSFLG